MPDIDDQFVDVDFETQEPYVFGDLGAATFGYPSYEKRFGTLSDAEINEAVDAMEAAGGGLELLVTRIMSQGQEGSCVGNSTTQAFEILQCKQQGAENVIPMSAISVYKQIGRSAQSGAVVSDAWTAINEVGLLPLDTPENRAKFGNHVMPHTGFSTPFPSGWKETAAKFKGLEAWNINTVDGLMTALCSGFPTIVGRSGHSICYVRPMRYKGNLACLYCNSWNGWGLTYNGMQGFGIDTTSQIRDSARYAFCLRSIRAPV